MDWYELPHYVKPASDSCTERHLYYRFFYFIQLDDRDQEVLGYNDWYNGGFAGNVNDFSGTSDDLDHKCYAFACFIYHAEPLEVDAAEADPAGDDYIVDPTGDDILIDVSGDDDITDVSGDDIVDDNGDIMDPSNDDIVIDYSGDDEVIDQAGDDEVVDPAGDDFNYTMCGCWANGYENEDACEGGNLWIEGCLSLFDDAGNNRCHWGPGEIPECAAMEADYWFYDYETELNATETAAHQNATANATVNFTADNGTADDHDYLIAAAVDKESNAYLNIFCIAALALAVMEASRRMMKKKQTGQDQFVAEAAVQV